MIHSGIFVAAFGAAIEELFHWWTLRSRLNHKKYRAVLTSPGYWIITGLMIAAAGPLAELWLSARATEPRDYLWFGLSLPLVLKKAASGGGRLTLGGGSADESDVALGDYL